MSVSIRLLEVHQSRFAARGRCVGFFFVEFVCVPQRCGVIKSPLLYLVDFNQRRLRRVGLPAILRAKS